MSFPDYPVLIVSLNTLCEHYKLFSVGPDGKVISLKKAKKPQKKTNPTKESTITKKKIVLKVSDVYSSEEEHFVEEYVKFKENFEYEDLKLGEFIVVEFEVEGKKKTTKDYVAVILAQNLDERELNVMFLKRYNNDDKLFFPDENDESYIDVDHIKGVLPQPEIVFKGDRLHYKFPGAVSLN